MTHEEEQGQKHRERSNVIPYDRSLARKQNDNEPTQADEAVQSFDATTPIGINDRDPEDILSERNMEAAQEIANPLPRRDTVEMDEGDDEEEAPDGNGIGVIALILSLVSIFFLPAVLGTAGIVTGYIAFRNGARTTGVWAMVIGAFSLIMALFVLPAYFR